MTTTRTALAPVKLFVSYAHKDARYRDEFHEALSPLRRRGLIEEWFDGEIVPGEAFDAVIDQHLQAADVIVMLLSKAYVNSYYCWEVEHTNAARERRKREVRVVGVVIKSVHLEGTDVSPHKLLPRDKKPVQAWRRRDEAWENVCQGIEQVIKDLRCPSQVDDALGVPKTIVRAASAAEERTRASRRGKAHALASVRAFWEGRGSAVVPGSIVSVSGTFSQFAPMLIGAPTAKRRLHKAFRQALEVDESLRRRKAPTLDACLSVSAGQMVWRLRPEGTAHAYFGLYESIVRNSVPVLVANEYRASRLDEEFRAAERKTFEARVTGRVVALNNTPAKRFLDKYGGGIVSREIVRELCRDVYALVVDGDGTGVERLGDPRYLDGDVWIAVESDGKERFLTSFVDIANPAERKQALEELLSKARALPGPLRIFSQYDEGQEFMPQVASLSTTNRFLDSVWKFASASR